MKGFPELHRDNFSLWVNNLVDYNEIRQKEKGY